MALDKAEIRLRCLKLARGMGGGVVQTPAKYIETATEFEDYVAGSLGEKVKRALTPKRSGKKSEEPDILS